MSLVFISLFAHAFILFFSKSIQTDFNKAIMVPVGLDSIQLIGMRSFFHYLFIVLGTLYGYLFESY